MLREKIDLCSKMYSEFIKLGKRHREIMEN